MPPDGAMRVLVLVPGALGDRLSGPEIRAWALAQALAQHHRVTAAVLDASAGERDGIRVVRWTRGRVLREALRHDVVLGACLPPYLLALKIVRPLLAVSDQYDPVDLELSTLAGRGVARRVRSARAVAGLQLRFSDLVLCASASQADAIAARQLELPSGSAAAAPLVVPFGVPPEPPASGARPLRAHFPAIGRDDTVVLWWGSIWRWLDAETAIRAVARAARRRPDLRLVLTTGRPLRRDTDKFSATEEARQLAASLGVLNENVFFLDAWIPYDERHLYLQEADIGLTLHRDTAEAPLAARARYMDYLWTALPSVLARGDDTAAAFGEAGFARVVEPCDEEATAAALLELGSDPAAREAASAAGRRLAAHNRWDAVTAPVVAALRAADTSRRRGRRPVALLGGAAAYYGRRAVDRVAG